MEQKYKTILTHHGERVIVEALANKIPVPLKEMAIGDGNGSSITPSASQTTLVREVYRAEITDLLEDPQNRHQMIAELLIPENVGGFIVREIGLFDEQGGLVAVANCPENYKPVLEQGSGKVQYYRMILQVSSSDAVTLSINNNIVYATRAEFDEFVNNLSSPDGYKHIGRCKSVAELRTIRPTEHGQRILVDAYYEDGTTGGGEFMADLQDLITPDDGGTCFVVEGNGGRWRRIGSATPYHFGALGDGVTDDIAAMQRYIASTHLLVIPQGTFRLSTLRIEQPIHFASGAAFFADAGAEITFVNEIESLAQHIFRGEGNFVLTNDADSGEQSRQAHISWWGVFPGEGGGDRAPLINKALAAFGNSREGVMYFDVGVYGIGSTVFTPRGVAIQGQGTRRTLFLPYSDGFPVFETLQTAVRFADIQFETPRGIVPIRKSPYILVKHEACKIENVMFTNSQFAVDVQADGAFLHNIGFNNDTQNGDVGSALILIRGNACTIDGTELKLGKTYSTDWVIEVSPKDGKTINGLSIRNIDSVVRSGLLYLNATTGSITNINVSNLNKYGVVGVPVDYAIKVAVAANRYISGANIHNININRHSLGGVLLDVQNSGQFVDFNLSNLIILGSSNSGTGVECRIGQGDEGIIRGSITNYHIVRQTPLNIPTDNRVQIKRS